MSIEDAILKLAAALEANTAAVLASGGTAAAAPATAPAAEKTTGKGKGKADAPATAPAAPKITRDEVNAALEQVREKFGVEEAKAIISGAGKAPKRADIAEENFAAVMAACAEKMQASAEEEM